MLVPGSLPARSRDELILPKWRFCPRSHNAPLRITRASCCVHDNHADPQLPLNVSRTLKARAAAEGQSLNEYLLTEVTRLAERPTVAEVAARAAQRGQGSLPPAAAILRAERPA